LSPEGRRDRLTRNGLYPVAAALTPGLATLDEADARLRTTLAARVASLEGESAPAPISEGRRAELVAVAQAYRALPKHERMRRLAAAQRDNAPDLETLEMTQHISPTIWGGTSNMQQLARAHGRTAIDEDLEVQRLVGVLDKAGTARADLTARREALVKAGDYAVFQEAGMVSKRMRDMTTREKSDYIDRYGLAAFKALPA
jgi:hypothetical protein